MKRFGDADLDRIERDSVSPGAMKRFVRGEIVTAARLNQLFDKVNTATLIGEPIHPESSLDAFLRRLRR